MEIKINWQDTILQKLNLNQNQELGQIQFNKFLTTLNTSREAVMMV